MLGFDSCRDFDRDAKRAGHHGSMGLINKEEKFNSASVVESLRILDIFKISIVFKICGKTVSTERDSFG